MRLVEQCIISKKHDFWKECDRVCFATKNLYNQALYRVIEHYKETKKYKNYNEIVKELAKEKQVDFVRLNTKISQQVLMLLDKNWKSFFKSLKVYEKNPEKFTGKPNTPKYLPKIRGRFAAVFTIQTISKPALKNGILKLSSCNIQIPTDKNVQQARIVPLKTGEYKIEIVYLKQEPVLTINERYAGIDIGLNNLATVVTNTELKPFIINGKQLKSVNQNYNKNLAKQKSALPHFINNKSEKKQRSYSKITNRLTHKRNCRADDLIHRASRKLVNILKQANISKVVIGKNKQWKTEINIGSKNNQKFVSIPHAEFISKVAYKLRMEGIECIQREESYTSKCSFLDGEEIKKHDTYLGKRIKRGLFKTATGFKWNADCNAAANILKKEIPNAFQAYGMKGTVVSPVIINPYQRQRSHKKAA